MNCCVCVYVYYSINIRTSIHIHTSDSCEELIFYVVMLKIKCMFALAHTYTHTRPRPRSHRTYIIQVQSRQKHHFCGCPIVIIFRPFICSFLDIFRILCICSGVRCNIKPRVWTFHLLRKNQQLHHQKSRFKSSNLNQSLNQIKKMEWMT